MRTRVVATALGLLCSVGAGGTPVTFTTLDRGQLSNIDEPREVVVRDAAEWTTLWRQHAGERARPAVAFDRESVVGVFLGSRPTGGFGVEITGIERDGGVLTVSYREQRPEPGAILSQVLTMPFHLVRIERHPGAVRFQRLEAGARR